jgi:hypothetical protein
MSLPNTITKIPFPQDIRFSRNRLWQIFIMFGFWSYPCLHTNSQVNTWNGKFNHRCKWFFLTFIFIKIVQMFILKYRGTTHCPNKGKTFWHKSPSMDLNIHWLSCIETWRHETTIAACLTKKILSSIRFLGLELIWYVSHVTTFLHNNMNLKHSLGANYN